jgi:hypothetical protein
LMGHEDDQNEEAKERVAAAVRERARDGVLACAVAFRLAEDLSVGPLEVGAAANRLGIRLQGCQLGLFRDSEGQRRVSKAEGVDPDLEQAIREGLVLGRLPCAVAWALAARFGIKKTDVANAAEWLGIRVSQCQLGAF